MSWGRRAGAAPLRMLRAHGAACVRARACFALFLVGLPAKPGGRRRVWRPCCVCMRAARAACACCACAGPSVCLVFCRAHLMMCRGPCSRCSFGNRIAVCLNKALHVQWGALHVHVCAALRMPSRAACRVLCWACAVLRALCAPTQVFCFDGARACAASQGARRPLYMSQQCCIVVCVSSLWHVWVCCPCRGAAPHPWRTPRVAAAARVPPCAAQPSINKGCWLLTPCAVRGVSTAACLCAPPLARS